MKKTLTLLSITALSACATFSDVEKEALRDRAIADASKQPKEIHLAYLQCLSLIHI